MALMKKPTNATINNNNVSNEQRVVGAGVAAAAAGSNQGWGVTHVTLYFDQKEIWLQCQGTAVFPCILKRSLYKVFLPSLFLNLTFVKSKWEMENAHLTGHQAHPLQPVPEASDEEEDLGSRKEARTLLICSYRIRNSVEQKQRPFLLI